MCSPEGIIFGALNLSEKEVKGKRIIEIGSRNVNGSVREILESYKPSEYIGVDIIRGDKVDMICRAENLVKKFGKNSFDIVISTELLEHTENWKSVISNIKNICKPNGIILITTCAIGFPYHPYPDDFWRYNNKDIQKIFSDCKIEKQETKRQTVMLKARKPLGFIENDLSDYNLYSIKSFRNMLYWFLVEKLSSIAKLLRRD